MLLLCFFICIGGRDLIKIASLTIFALQVKCSFDVNHFFKVPSMSKFFRRFFVGLVLAHGSMLGLLQAQSFPQ